MSHKSLMDTRLLDKDRPNWTGPGGKWRKMRKNIKNYFKRSAAKNDKFIALFVPWNSILWISFSFSFFPCKLSKQQALILSSKRRLVPRANSFVTFCQLIKPEINRQDSGNLTTLYFHRSCLDFDHQSNFFIICLLLFLTYQCNLRLGN